MATTPIVTEVTKAQLDALVVANGLNEGLQYKITDKGYRVTATSINTYSYASVSFRSFLGLITQNGENAPVVTVLNNDLCDITFSRIDAGNFLGTFAEVLDVSKIVAFITPTQEGYLNDFNKFTGIQNSYVQFASQAVSNGVDTSIDSLLGSVVNCIIEIRYYDL